MDFYFRFFHPGVKIAIFSPGFVRSPSWTIGGYEPGVITLSPRVKALILEKEKRNTVY